MSHRAALTLLALLPAWALSQPVDPSLYGSLAWRNLGPERGGRSIACSGVPGKPDHFYMGTTGGGLWKTLDAGETWAPVSDGFFQTGAVGAVAVAPSRPETVYVGMGESALRGNVSHGDGVYRSDDGGKTWTHAGLKDSQTVSRIAVHPSDPETAWAAVLGHVYGPHPERGVFKTTDGGKTWRRTLYVGDRAGGVDLCLDPNEPKTLYASTWDGWRTPWSLSSGGLGSKLWKSTDGGETWTDLSSRPGLPSAPLGKIGVSASGAKPGRVWAIVEAKEGGLFLSDDGGGTWKRVDSSRERLQRAFYYMRVQAHPTEPDTVFVLNVACYRSTNAGASFTAIPAGHSDHHDIWIDPSDPRRIAVSNDGGTTVSTDGGRSWTEQDYSTAQIYHVSTDNAFPYNVLGAQQDNSTIRIASRTRSARIGEDDWEPTAGGESGFVVAKPDEPHIVVGGSYGGYLQWLDHRSRISRSIDVWPDNPMGSGAGANRERFQWTFPILFSRHDPNVLYACSQHVHRSDDLGGSWRRISPDLSRNDPRTLGSSGGPITQDNTSVEYYGTVFALDESPLAQGLLWAGTDDGRVHVTRDGGANWADVTPREMPEWGLVSSVDPSPHAEGTCLIAVDRHEMDDFRPYIFRTTDFGKTWRQIGRGLPEGAFVRVVREDPKRHGLLVCGTEVGAFVSHDSGGHWTPLMAGMPATPVHDLVFKGDDIVAATHGRGFYILDLVSPLRHAPDVKPDGKAALYPPASATTYTWGPAMRGTGANPPSGVVVDYLLRTKAEKAELAFFDQEGRQVARLDAKTEPGQHRATTAFRYPGYRSVPGMVFWAAGSRPVKAPPGQYLCRLTVDGEVHEVPVRLERDPRYPGTDVDLQAQFDLTMKIVARTSQANSVVVLLREASKLVAGQRQAAPAEADALVARAEAVSDLIHQGMSRSSQDPLNYPIRLNNKLAALIGTVQAGEWRPTAQAYAVFADLSAQLDAALARCRELLDGLPALNRKLEAGGGKAVSLPAEMLQAAGLAP